MDILKKIDDMIEFMECTPCKGYIQDLKEIKKEVKILLNNKK